MIMHLAFFSPVLADVLLQPWGGVFLVLLSVAALFRRDK
jgi:hypothetical protein